MTAAASEPVLDPGYRAFLEAELPLLAKRSMSPWLRWLYGGKLRTLLYCLRHVPVDPGGLIAEFGVHQGRSIRLIGRRWPRRRIFGFDSFEGFPEDGRKDWRQDFSTGGVMPEVPPNVTLVKGFFDATLPGFVAGHAGKHLSMLHIDCDIYSSTRVILRECRPMIRPGCIIVFDELLHYNGFLRNEFLALWEFVRDTGIAFEWVVTGGKVMPLDRFLDTADPARAALRVMADWRAAGYDTAAALRVTRVP